MLRYINAAIILISTVSNATFPYPFSWWVAGLIGFVLSSAFCYGLVALDRRNGRA